jgi:ubiquinone/menaquinone biosynthesis C-methylase UbiE
MAIHQENVRNYDAVAWFYEQSSRLYSTNQIRKSKAAQIQYIRPGDRVLYLGVGAGEDALMAAARGARVTCIDLSRKMLDRLDRRLRQRGLAAELLCQDARQHERVGEYDVVATNYFLNCFRAESMKSMLRLAASFCRPGGCFMIADVALPQGTWIERAFNVAYLKSAMALFWSLGLVPWHANYDYARELPEAGIQLRRVQYFRFLKRGPVLFQNIVGQKAV